MFRRLLTIVGATLVVVGCSAGSTESLPDQQAAWNEADVEFVTGMIPHHEQALEMADLIAGKSVSNDVAVLADEIRAAQGPEIAVMQGYLAQWGTKTDPHAGHGGGLPLVDLDLADGTRVKAMVDDARTLAAKSTVDLQPTAISAYRGEAVIYRS